MLLHEAELGGSAVVEGGAVEGHGGASLLPSSSLCIQMGTEAARKEKRHDIQRAGEEAIILHLI